MIAGIVLAAGRSRRYGRLNKLLDDWQGRPLLWWTLDAVCASGLRPIVIVMGHDRAAIQNSLTRYRRRHRCRRSWRLRFNRDHRRGLSTSLRTGIAALPQEVRGAVVALGDMPAIDARLIDALRDAAMRTGTEAIDAVIPVHGQQRGNPVLLTRRLFEAVSSLRGDEGARRLLRRSRQVQEIDAPAGIGLDIDRRRDHRRQALGRFR